jgi:hypothetical protein
MWPWQSDLWTAAPLLPVSTVWWGFLLSLCSSGDSSDCKEQNKQKDRTSAQAGFNSKEILVASLAESLQVGLVSGEA